MLFYKKRYAPAGARPGMLVIDEHAVETSVYVMNYSAEGLDEKPIANEDILVGNADWIRSEIENPNTITWVDVKGLGNEELLVKIADIFSLHLLTVADVVNAPQRPKVEFLDDHTLFICSMLRVGDDLRNHTEQVSVIIGKNFVVTFQEKPGDVFDPVRERLRHGRGLIRKRGSDYLAYALIDAVVDNYFPVLETYSDYLEQIEEEVIANPTEDTLQKIYQAKRELLSIRRAIWPKREALQSLTREDSAFIDESTRIFLRDTYDHSVQLIDIVETYRELVSGFMDVYLSSISNRMNDIMKVLTIIGTIFIPMSFFAGVYGMNFEHIPELKWEYSYYVFWACMLGLSGGLCLFFWKLGWIGKK